MTSRPKHGSGAANPAARLARMQALHDVWHALGVLLSQWHAGVTSRSMPPCTRPRVLHDDQQHAPLSPAAAGPEDNLERACDRHAACWQQLARGPCPSSLILRGRTRPHGPGSPHRTALPRCGLPVREVSVTPGGAPRYRAPSATGAPPWARPREPGPRAPA